MQHAAAPPNAQLHTLNDKVAASVQNTNVHFPTSVTPLPSHGEQPLCAAVSSFGYSGTIAHAVLEEAGTSMILTLIFVWLCRSVTAFYCLS